MRKLILPICGVLIVALSGCSDTAAPKAEKKKEAEKLEPATGQSAIYKMYQKARSWAPDVQVLNMSSMPLPDVPTVPPGTAAAWQATYTSTERSLSSRCTYSIEEGEGNLHKGVFCGSPEGWSGAHGTNTPFVMAAVKIDTDAAYKIALDHGGADYDKKTPGQPISFLLEKVAKHPNPVWRVIWGPSVAQSNFSIYVDASTGDFKEKLH